jgi:acetyl esterase
MPLDRENQLLVDQMRARMPPAGSLPAHELRKRLAEASLLAPKGPDLARVEDSAAGTVPIRIYVPTAKPLAVIAYMHGGGFTIGSIPMWDFTLRKLAQTTSCAVISVDYRLAPEYPFPAAVEDTMEAVRWTAEHVSDIVSRAVPVIVAGDSAGATLATVACVLARDSGGPSIAAQVLIYPAATGDIDDPSLRQFEPPRLTIEDIAWYWDQYIPDRERRMDPRFAPARTEDLTGLPPAFILTAENDILRHDGEEYGLKLVRAGVPVTLRRYLGTAHGFFNFIGVRQWEECHLDIASFIRATLPTGARRKP